MRLFRTIRDYWIWRETEAGSGSVGFVPTMGALHAGHISLLDRLRAECDHAVCSIFVNPTQFGPNEDLARYPRPLEADLALCQQAGVDAVFLPEVEEMYPAGAVMTVEVGPLGTIYEGAIRPGHFSGVATVVLKLFCVARASRAYFGEKDFQQLCIIRRMVADFNFPIQIVPCRTVREADGLALSSRNVYLNPEQRAAATALSRCLFAMRRLFLGGNTDPAALLVAGQASLAESGPAVQLEYLALVDPETFATASVARGESRALIAARVGSTRLIDNIALFEQAELPQPRATLGARA
jgi:pantoate--beta-alanine ligase